MSGCKNSVWRIMRSFKEYKFDYLIMKDGVLNPKVSVQMVEKRVMENYKKQWLQDIKSEKSRHGKGGNKLRTYKELKNVYAPEPYALCIMGKKQRSALAKLRCGTAPIRIETGRYEGIPVEERFCSFCTSEVEDELHVLTKCPVYADLRDELYSTIGIYMPSFNIMSDVKKMQILLASDDFNILKLSAKTCQRILERRKNFVNHST